LHVSNCKTVDVINKKPILIARFLLNAEWTTLGENSFASNSFTVWNLETVRCLLCMAERKFTRLSTNSRAGDLI
jgi:hypothetical protein